MSQVAKSKTSNIRKYFDEWRLHQEVNIKWLKLPALNRILKMASKEIEKELEAAAKHRRLSHVLGDEEIANKYEKLQTGAIKHNNVMDYTDPEHNLFHTIIKNPTIILKNAADIVW